MANSSYKAQNAQFFQKYLGPQSGVHCIIFGIMMILCAAVVYVLPHRLVMFWYMIGVGIAVLILGSFLLISRAFFPQIIPERRRCERILCRCIP